MRQPLRRLRSRRRHGDRQGAGWEIESVGLAAPAGPNVRAATMEEVMAAAGAVDPELPWRDVAPRIIPALERMRPFPSGYPTPVRTIVPPGVSINLAIDIGPAVMHVSQALVDAWSMPLAELAAHALGNLHERARRITPREVVHERIGHASVGLLQTGLGIGSTLVLVPHELARIFGAESRLFVAPMRDVLVGIPPGELDIAAELYAGLASADPNCLQPRVYRFDGETVQVGTLG